MVKNDKKWCVLMSVCYVANGAAWMTQQNVSKLGFEKYFGTFMLAYFVSAAMFALAILVFQRVKPGFRDILIGVLLGFTLSTGTRTTLLALSAIPSVIYLPINLSIGTILTALIAWLLWKEKLNIFGFLGLFMGIIGIILVTSA